MVDGSAASSFQGRGRYNGGPRNPRTCHASLEASARSSSSQKRKRACASVMRSALVLAVATAVAGGFVSPATTRTGHLGVRLLVPMTAAPALALRSIPLARSSPTSHRCSPTSMGPPDRSGRRLGGRKPEEQPPAAPPRADEPRAALSRADELPATFRAITRYGYKDLLGEMATSMATLLPEPTAVIAFAGGLLLACVQLAAMLLLAYAIYYSSNFDPAVDAVIQQVYLPLCTCVLCWPSRRTTSKSTDPLRIQVRDPRSIRGSPEDPKKASKQLIASAIAMLHTQTLEGSWNEDNSILSVTAFFLEGRALAKERLIGLSWSVCRVRLE